MLLYNSLNQSRCYLSIILAGTRPAPLHPSYKKKGGGPPADLYISSVISNVQPHRHPERRANILILHPYFFRFYYYSQLSNFQPINSILYQCQLISPAVFSLNSFRDLMAGPDLQTLDFYTRAQQFYYYKYTRSNKCLFYLI